MSTLVTLSAVTNDSILVFREQDYYFGISPADFGPPFMLDQLEIAPTNVSEAIWYYRDKEPLSEEEAEGIFLHLGALFGLRPIGFGFQGMIFLNELAPGLRLGLFLDNLTFRVPIWEVPKRLIEVTSSVKLPPELPPRAIRQVISYNRKQVLLIDPVRLSEVYQLIAPERIRNLLKAYHQEL
ncbi:MAG: hypothetical protein RRB13_05960 [bacterium]|nr:hypothetical protein [bacterium]